MRKIVTSLTSFTAAAAAALMAPSAIAQDADGSETMVEDGGAMPEGGADDDLDAVMGMMSGLFTAEPLTAEEDARLPAASRVAGAMMPDGFYGEMMEKLMDTTMRPMFDMFSEPSMIVASRTGADPDMVDALGAQELTELAAILDPAYDRRGDAIIGTIGAMMKDIGTSMEAPMREGYSRAFAKRFESGELAEIEQFFVTPTGSTFASETMALFSDPEVMSSIMGSMPAMFSAMGDMESTMEAAMAALPLEPEYADLTAAQRVRLTSALGIDEVQLELAMTASEDEAMDEDAEDAMMEDAQ